MRVAILQEQVDGGRGGAETSTLELAHHLAAQGLSITLVCSAASHLADRRHAAPPIALRAIAPRGVSRRARTAHFVREVDRLCRREGFDLVHAVSPVRSADVYQPRGGIYAEAVARGVARAAGPGGRLVRRVAGRFRRRQRLLLRLERALLSGPDPPLVVAVSEYVRRQLQAAFPGFPQQRVRVVFNGVDVARLQRAAQAARRGALANELGLPPGRPLVLFVAHNFRLKGLAELMRAAATPCGRQADWCLAVAGRDNPRPFGRLARRLGIAPRVRFLGTGYPVALLYASAGLLAHPTWYDPCSRVVLEALACGLPVVTTCWNGAAELIEPGRHGEVIGSPRDADALAAAIGRCLEPGLARACRLAAGATGARVSMRRHARELCALYRQLAGARRSGA